MLQIFIYSQKLFIFLSRLKNFSHTNIYCMNGNFVPYNVLRGEYIVRVLLWGRQDKINFVRNDYVDIYIIWIVYKMPGRQNYSSRNYYVGPDRNCGFLRGNKNYTFLDTHVPCLKTHLYGIWTASIFPLFTMPITSSIAYKRTHTGVWIVQFGVDVIMVVHCQLGCSCQSLQSMLGGPPKG